VKCTPSAITAELMSEAPESATVQSTVVDRPGMTEG
jgi:hypothetical protein